MNPQEEEGAPIVLPLLQTNDFNFALHEDIFLRMQVYIYGTIENVNPENEGFNHQAAWDDMRYDITNQINIQARRMEDLQVINGNVNNQAVDNDGNDIDNEQQQLQQNEQNNQNNPAMRLLGNYAQRLNNEEAHNEENNMNHHPENIVENMVNPPEYNDHPIVNIGSLRTEVEVTEYRNPNSYSDYSGYSSDEPER